MTGSSAVLRVREPEWMDDPAVDAVELDDVLDVLDRTNRFFGSDRALFRAVRRFGEIESVLDIGCGGGGFLRFLRERTANRPPRLMGLDFSPFVVERARRSHADGFEFIRADARAIPLADASVDIVTSSLFLHHFDPPDVVAILREAARVARRGIVISDLTRSRLGWLATWIVTRTVTRNRLFRTDGPRSVRAAFTPEELRELLSAAGLVGARVRRAFPFRMIAIWTHGGAKR